MTQCMAGRVFGYARPTYGLPDCFLEDGFMEMVPAPLTCLESRRPETRRLGGRPGLQCMAHPLRALPESATYAFLRLLRFRSLAA